MKTHPTIALGVALSTILAGAALAQAPAAPPAGQPARPPAPPVRSPAFDLALEAANTAIKTCSARGQHVGVVVLDAGGQQKLTMIPDGVNGRMATFGFRKANTALLLGAPSEDSIPRGEADAALKAKLATPDYINLAGGLPIKVGDEVIGAIGVAGGSPSSQDKACGEEALKAIQSRLK